MSLSLVFLCFVFPLSQFFRVFLDLKWSIVFAKIAQVLAGIRTVASFNGQHFEIERYGKCLEEGRRSGIRKAFIIALFSGIYQLVMYLVMGAAFWQVSFSHSQIYHIGRLLPSLGTAPCSSLTGLAEWPPEPYLPSSGSSFRERIVLAMPCLSSASFRVQNWLLAKFLGS